MCQIVSLKFFSGDILKDSSLGHEATRFGDEHI